MNDAESDVGRFLVRVATAVPNGMGVVFGKKSAAPSRGERVAEAEAVTPQEQDWLDKAIGADGEIDELEQALLAFVAQETARA